MLVFIFVIVLIIVFRNNLGTHINLYSKNENRYVFIICAFFVLLAALRWISLGSDIESFKYEYYSIQTYSFRDMWERWQGNYIVYYAASKIFGYSKLPYQFWFGIVQLLSVSGFIRIVNKFSSDRLFCLLLYFTIGIFIFSISGLKQALSMGLIWHAFASLYDKKYFWAVLVSLLAFYSHKTSGFFILSYPMLFIKSNKSVYTIIVSIAIAAMAILPTQLLNIFLANLGEDHYSNYLNEEATYSYITFLFYLLLYGIALLSKRKNSNSSVNNRLILSFASISVVTNLFAQISASAFRLALYYAPFLIILLSNRIKNSNLRLAVMLLTAFYMLYTGRNLTYKFFWQ